MDVRAVQRRVLDDVFGDRRELALGGRRREQVLVGPYPRVRGGGGRDSAEQQREDQGGAGHPVS
jgi:hypothetical protein